MRAPVHCFFLCAYQHPFTVGRKDVTIKPVELFALCIVDIEKNIGLFSRFKRIPYHALTVGADLCIQIAAFDGGDTADGLSRQTAVGNGLQIQFIICRHTQRTQ